MSPAIVASLLLAGLASGGRSTKGQDIAPRPPAPPPTPVEMAQTHVSLEELLGADVRLEPSPAEKPESGADAKDSKDSRKDKAREKPRDGEPRPDPPKGKVRDLVISANDGQIVAAALSVGAMLGTADRVVLVPAAAVRCTTNEKKPCCLLRMTKAEVEALPEFEASRPERESLDRAVDRMREASGMPRERAPSASGPPVPVHFLASELQGCRLGASDREFGRVRDAAVDLGGNLVAYLLVSHGGVAGIGDRVYLVPFRACGWTRVDGESFLRVAQTAEHLAAAPEYEAPEQGLLKPEQMRMADAHFAGAKIGARPQ